MEEQATFLSLVSAAWVDIAQTANDGTHNAFAMYATSGGLFYGLYYSKATVKQDPGKGVAR